MNSPKKLIRIAVSAALAASMLLPNAFALYPAKVKADALYLREAPEGNIIATLPQDTVLAVVNNSNSWFKVVVNGREGYVSGEYLTGTLTSDFNLGTGHIVCDTTVNLREQPNTSSSVLASLSNSTAVSVTGVYQGWYKVSCNGKNGYVHPDYITFAAVQTPAPAENKAPVTPDSNVVSYTGTSEARAEVLEYAAQFLGTPYVCLLYTSPA